MLGAFVVDEDVVRRVGDYDRIGERVNHLLETTPLLRRTIVALLRLNVRGNAKEDRPRKHDQRGDFLQQRLGNDTIENDDAARRAREAAILERNELRAGRR